MNVDEVLELLAGVHSAHLLAQDLQHASKPCDLPICDHAFGDQAIGMLKLAVQDSIDLQ